MEDFKSFFNIYEEASELTKFTQVLKNFNSGDEIDPAYKLELEEYFAFRWEFYRGHAFTEEWDKITCNIPEWVIDKMKCELVFKDMIS